MDAYIRTLVDVFQANPWQFFHEREIHSRFFGISRDACGMAHSAGGYCVHLLRQDYNTLWRYHGNGDDAFGIRLGAGEGDVGEIDFVTLKQEFVVGRPYLEVMNKEETIRQPLRDAIWQPNGLSPIIQCGLEFKMAHVHPVGPLANRGQGVNMGHFNVLGFVSDCRKLACERAGIGYVATLMHQPHGNWFNNAFAANLFNECVDDWNRCDAGPGPVGERLRLLIVSPDQCFQRGNWAVQFPNGVAV